MDFEVEIGAFIGNKGNNLGRPIKIGEAEDYIFGITLLNDWSVRDV
jgi:fumarylacetoacetase